MPRLKVALMTLVLQTDHRLDSSAIADQQFLLRHKKSNAETSGYAGVVLFVHGATYAASLTYDYSVDGLSWIDRMALDAFDCWAIDLLGYGGADRPAAMDAPAADNPPLTDTADAEADVISAIDYILATTGQQQIMLIGYSWGTAICGGVAAAHGDKISRLILLGALWTNIEPRGVRVDGALGAYRLVDSAAAAARWVIGLSEAQIAAVVPPGRIDAWVAATLASDPANSPEKPQILRAPAGVVKDIQTYWTQNIPTYEPAAITPPTMVIMGEWDHETTPEQGWNVFQRLTGAAERRYVVIGEGSHSLPLENQRGALFAVVDSYLKEAL
jgi:pimeloyl-ACP methyl ester carboxylesterase